MIRRTIMSVAVALVMATGASAQTVGYADAIEILAKTCGKDIQSYCPKAQLANWGIGTCLNEHSSQISAECANSLVSVRQSLDARIAAQKSAEKVCSGDIGTLCSRSKPGKGHVLQCLLKAEPSVSKRCNEAITNAGWR